MQIVGLHKSELCCSLTFKLQHCLGAAETVVVVVVEYSPDPTTGQTHQVSNPLLLQQMPVFLLIDLL